MILAFRKSNHVLAGLLFCLPFGRSPRYFQMYAIIPKRAKENKYNPYIIFKKLRDLAKYIYRINGEERIPTIEKRKKLYSTLVQAISYPR